MVAGVRPGSLTASSHVAAWHAGEGEGLVSAGPCAREDADSMGCEPAYAWLRAVDDGLDSAKVLDVDPAR